VILPAMVRPMAGAEYLSSGQSESLVGVKILLNEFNHPRNYRPSHPDRVVTTSSHFQHTQRRSWPVKLLTEVSRSSWVTSFANVPRTP